MLQHYFRPDSSTCLSSTQVIKIVKTISVAVCLIHLLLTLHETAISKQFKILNTFLFRFSIITNEVKVWPLCDKQVHCKFEYLSFKFNSCWKFYLHKYAITLVLLKIVLFVSLFCMYDVYLNFRMLTTLHHFNFNLMTNKSSQHRKVLDQMKFFCFKSKTFNSSRRTYIIQLPILVTKHILKPLACSKTLNYCSWILSVYPKFLHV
jgi:hypothetical protein